MAFNRNRRFGAPRDQQGQYQSQGGFGQQPRPSSGFSSYTGRQSNNSNTNYNNQGGSFNSGYGRGGGRRPYQDGSSSGGPRGGGRSNISSYNDRDSSGQYNQSHSNTYVQRRGGGFRGGRGRGGGGPSGPRGPSRLKLATDISEFSGEIAAHETDNKIGITSLAIWPENKQLFTGGVDGVVRMWDFQGNKISEQPTGLEIGCLQFVMGWLFVGYTNPGLPNQTAGFIKAYNFNQTPPVETEFKMSDQFPAAHHGQITKICANSDMVLTSSNDGCVKAWKLNLAANTWALVGNYGGEKAHAAPVKSLLSVKDVTVSGSSTGEIKVWSTAGGNQVTVVQAHADSVTDLLFWENEEYHVVVSCSLDGTIKAWDIATLGSPQVNAMFEHVPDRPKPLSCLTATALTSGRPILLCGYGDGSIQIYDLPDFEDLGFLKGHLRNNAITSISQNVDGIIFAGSLNGKLACYNIA